MPALPSGCRVLRIEDRYLTGTRLRLRTVQEDGAAPVVKLGQKVPVDGTAVAHTTVYLSPAEFDLLAGLPAQPLVKVRTLVPWGALVLAVDVFGGDLAGLVLAEVDLGAAGELPTEPPPVRWLREVTDDPRYDGGSLAAARAVPLHA